MMNQRNCPKLAAGKQNLGGALVRCFRNEAGWSQEQLAAKMQIAGWDVDRVVVTRIESGQRTLLDYEVRFFLDLFGKRWRDLEK